MTLPHSTTPRHCPICSGDVAGRRDKQYCSRKCQVAGRYLRLRGGPSSAPALPSELPRCPTCRRADRLFWLGDHPSDSGERLAVFVCRRCAAAVVRTPPK